MATGKPTIPIIPSNDIYRGGWSAWVLSKTDSMVLTDGNQNLTMDYWACKKAFTAGWQEGLRCLDE